MHAVIVNTGQRRLRARIAALALHAQGGTNTAAARSRFMQRFEQEVDPEGLLPELERRRRADFARRLYFARLALLSAKARASGAYSKDLTVRHPADLCVDIAETTNATASTTAAFEEDGDPTAIPQRRQ